MRIAGFVRLLDSYCTFHSSMVYNYDMERDFTGTCLLILILGVPSTPGF